MADARTTDGTCVLWLLLAFFFLFRMWRVSDRILHWFFPCVALYDKGIDVCWVELDFEVLTEILLMIRLSPRFQCNEYSMLWWPCLPTWASWSCSSCYSILIAIQFYPNTHDLFVCYLIIVITVFDSSPYFHRIMAAFQKIFNRAPLSKSYDLINATENHCIIIICASYSILFEHNTKYVQWHTYRDETLCSIYAIFP